MSRNTQRTFYAAVVLVAVVAGVAWPMLAKAQAGPAQRTLEGTWLVSVTTLADCHSRTPLGTFTALLTFAHDGTMTGTTTNPAFAIGQRSTDHGVWSRTNDAHTYQASSLALLQFATPPNLPVTPGFQAGGQRLDQTIALADEYRFTSDATVQFFDTAGRKYREGCAVAAGRRFE